MPRMSSSTENSPLGSCTSGNVAWNHVSGVAAALFQLSDQLTAPWPSDEARSRYSPVKYGRMAQPLSVMSSEPSLTRPRMPLK